MDSYISIIEECKKLGIRKIIPYLMNEPLLDQDIAEKIKITRKIYPECFIELCTNGILLKDKMAKQLAELQIDEFRVSVIGRNPDKHMGIKYENVKTNIEAFRDIKHPATNMKIVILANSDISYWRGEGYSVITWGLTSRAGNIIQRRKRENRKGGCIHNRHNQWLHVMWDGQIVLCCMDWKREAIIGDLKEGSIQHILSSEKISITRKLVESNNDNIICSRCEWAK
jgi:radical SAM protein with 4Fe4S-binding SPASM domain